MLALALDEASVKIRTGEPKDEDEDYDLDYWAGVLPMTLTIGQAIPDPLLRPEIQAPDAHRRAGAPRRRQPGEYRCDPRVRVAHNPGGTGLGWGRD